jgi:hypothetical protein
VLGLNYFGRPVAGAHPVGDVISYCFLPLQGTINKLEVLRVRLFLMLLIILSGLVFCGVADSAYSQTGAQSSNAPTLLGRWRVKVNLVGSGEENLIFDSKPHGSGSAWLISGDQEGKISLPAAWSLSTNQRASFSTELELPIGTCCREVGTLVLKGKLDPKGTVTGRAVFITSTDDEESLIGLRTLTGTFTAVKIVN